MRVLMFGWEFPPFQAGGLATATLGLVKGLLDRGIEVTLVVPFPAAAPEVSTSGSWAPPSPPGASLDPMDSPLEALRGAEQYPCWRTAPESTPAAQCTAPTCSTRSSATRRSPSGSPARSRTT